MKDLKFFIFFGFLTGSPYLVSREDYSFTISKKEDAPETKKEQLEETIYKVKDMVKPSLEETEMVEFSFKEPEYTELPIQEGQGPLTQQPNSSKSFTRASEQVSLLDNQQDTNSHLNEQHIQKSTIPQTRDLASYFQSIVPASNNNLLKQPTTSESPNVISQEEAKGLAKDTFEESKNLTNYTSNNAKLGGEQNTKHPGYTQYSPIMNKSRNYGTFADSRRINQDDPSLQSNSSYGSHNLAMSQAFSQPTFSTSLTPEDKLKAQFFAISNEDPLKTYDSQLKTNFRPRLEYTNSLENKHENYKPNEEFKGQSNSIYPSEFDISGKFDSNASQQHQTNTKQTLMNHPTANSTQQEQITPNCTLMNHTTVNPIQQYQSNTNSTLMNHTTVNPIQQYQTTINPNPLLQNTNVQHISTRYTLITPFIKAYRVRLLHPCIAQSSTTQDYGYNYQYRENPDMRSIDLNASNPSLPLNTSGSLYQNSTNKQPSYSVNVPSQGQNNGSLPGQRVAYQQTTFYNVPQTTNYLQ